MAPADQYWGARIAHQLNRDLDRVGGSFYVWHRQWPLPEVAARPGGDVTLDTSPSVGLIARLAELSESEVNRRLGEGHNAYLLKVSDQPAAYGWSATAHADIGGLGLSFDIPPDQRYLWDFVTLPAYRGRRLYPLLLHEIVARERDDAAWFWIGHEPPNLASQSGILKAGFKAAGDVWRLRDGGLVIAAAAGAPEQGADAVAKALGLALVRPS